jgi:hypothetical protein
MASCYSTWGGAGPSPVTVTTALALIFPMRTPGSRVGDSTEVQVVRLSQLSMSVRVVARIRPLLKSENEIDAIVRTSGADESARPNVVKVPNPKNFSEEFSFQFNSVYGENATQQEIFDAEGELQGPSGTENDIDNVLQ